LELDVKMFPTEAVQVLHQEGAVASHVHAEEEEEEEMSN